MSDIELVIRMPKKTLKDIKMLSDYGYNSMFNGLVEVISNGTPLPKGHGDLVDYEELKNNAREYGAYAEATLSHIKPKIIIETDEAGSEE